MILNAQLHADFDIINVATSMCNPSSLIQADDPDGTPAPSGHCWHAIRFLVCVVSFLAQPLHIFTYFQHALTCFRTLLDTVFHAALLARVCSIVILAIACFNKLCSLSIKLQPSTLRGGGARQRFKNRSQQLSHLLSLSERRWMTSAEMQTRASS